MSPEDKKKSAPKAKKAESTKAPKAPKELKTASDKLKTSEKPKKEASGPAIPRGPLAPRTIYTAWDKVTPKWRLVDAAGQRLGRMSSQVAHLLMGKHLPHYTRHAGTGDFVIVINASKVVLTGKKWSDKLYQWHTGYPGGIKTLSARELFEKKPERLVEEAVSGMLPKGSVGRLWRKRLRIFAGSEHPHQAQQPEAFKLPPS